MEDIIKNNRASRSSPPAGQPLDLKKPIETTEQLRIAIDQGNDKVDASDPAASPLGTDDEAGGSPNSMAQVRLAAAQEIRPSAKRQRTTGFGKAWWLVAIALFIGTSVPVLLYMFRQ